jgi:hypothetical protein
MELPRLPWVEMTAVLIYRLYDLNGKLTVLVDNAFRLDAAFKRFNYVIHDRQT